MTTPVLNADRALMDLCEVLESPGGLLKVAAGSKIFEQGEPGDYAYLIDQGYVEVSYSDDGRKGVLGLLGPGEVFGEIALLDGKARSASATALHETTLFRISRKDLHDAVDSANALARLVVIGSINRLRSTRTRNPLQSEGEGSLSEQESRICNRYETARAAAADMVRLRFALEQAISKRQFELVYQPIVSLADGRAAGFEALIRWPQPGGRPVSPLEFIPLAEETGLIVPLGLWILEQGLHVLSTITRSANGSRLAQCAVFVSINVSPRQLDTEENVERLASMIERADVDSSNVKLEITEQTLLSDPRMATIGLARLKETGAKIAIDDFGTGYSSLNYLHRFPLDTLKIDRSFIQQVHENPGGQRVVTAIIGLARDLGMDVVAEGIEQIGELRWLQSRGCQYGQGYLMAKPAPLGEALAYLNRSFEW